MKTLVIFDIDGTLLHSNKVDSQCFAETYEAQFGKEFPTIDWRAYPHVTDHTIFNAVIQQHFGRPATGKDIELQREHFVKLLKRKRIKNPKEFSEVPGAVNTVNQLLKDETYIIGIATGGWEKPARLKLKHLMFPLERFYMSFADNKVTREDILTEAITKAKSEHDQIGRIVYVGDAIWDVKTTRNMGLNFVGIRIEGDLEVLRSAGAATVLKNYQDYTGFIQAIQRATPPK